MLPETALPAQPPHIRVQELRLALADVYIRFRRAAQVRFVRAMYPRSVASRIADRGPKGFELTAMMDAIR